MKLNKFMLLSIILVFDYAVAKEISEMKCDETASLLTDPRSIAPYLMEIQIKPKNKPILNCSVTLISENFVLTTGLCVTVLQLLPFKEQIKIRKTKFPEEEYTNNQYFTINRVIPHELYNYTSLENQYDYGLIQLNEPVPYQNGSIFRPACLWTDFAYPIDTYLMFGHALGESNRISLFKNISAANIDTCLDFIQYKMENRSTTINESHVCFIINQGQYLSNHANPLVANFANKNYIFGIESRTYTNDTTRMIWSHKIHNVVPWIESTVWPNQVNLECGKRKIKHRALIAFAEPTYHGEFPWHVALFQNNHTYSCGGTIINNRTILTAAHCVHGPQGVVPHNYITIVVGTNNLGVFPIEAKIYDVQSIIPHPHYTRTYLENDIALLKLEYDIEFSNFIQPICLSKSLDYDNITYGLVAGWGKIEHNQQTDLLRQATLPIPKKNECLASNRDFFKQYLNDGNYCAGNRNGTNICSGDSGSAMIFEYKSTWYIRGMVSLGVALKNSDRCDITEMVLFTDVPKFYDWIIENVQDEQ